MDTETESKDSIKSFGTFFRLCLTYAAIAIISGIIINTLSLYLQDNFVSNELMMILIQLIFMIVILFVIERLIAPMVGRSWQDITPGLFFVAIYFSTQYNLFRNITSLGERIYKKR